MIAAFGDVARVSLGGFREVFETVTAGAADAGVVPIENVINGTVRENYDLLLEHDLEIRGEVVVPVRALPGGAARAAPRRHRAGLLAHPGTRPGRGVPASPAVAAAVDLQHGRRRQGHRRSRRARRGGRPVAAGGGAVRARDPRRRDRRPAGQPDALRRARPARTSRRRRCSPGPGHGSRTTLVVAVRNEPGTLLEVLRVFAAHGLNMSKLESRPSRERAWEYVFWVDLDVDADDPAFVAALAELEGVTTMSQGPRVVPARRRLAGSSGTRLGLRPGACAARRGSRSGGLPRPMGRPALPP